MGCVGFGQWVSDAVAVLTFLELCIMIEVSGE